MIEKEAAFLVEEYALRESSKDRVLEYPPVPYESIIERHLELTLDYPDLRRELGHSDISPVTSNGTESNARNADADNYWLS